MRVYAEKQGELMSKYTRNIKANWRLIVYPTISAFLGFVLFSPDTFSRWPLVVSVANYAAIGGLAVFGVRVTRNQYNKRKFK
jgi:hypothetical protein